MRGARIGLVVAAVLFLLSCQNPTSDDESIVAPSYLHGEGVPLLSTGISSWAIGYSSYTKGDEANSYTDPGNAIGAASGVSTDVVVLGRGGSIVLEVAPFGDTQGADFAVWENGIEEESGLFAELGYVEVSSNGSDFLRFPVQSRRTTLVGAYEAIDTSLYDGFAGVHAAGTGTAFDLSLLSSMPSVTDRTVDLSAIRYIRIVDVVGGRDDDGDGQPDTHAEIDSDGDPIYDPFPTSGTAGFDLDGVAVLR